LILQWQTPIATWSLNENHLANGSSFEAPKTTGCAKCVIAALTLPVWQALMKAGLRNYAPQGATIRNPLNRQ
jgi:hypothetical protein